ncbi:MAG TPA: lipoyl(octanoyl) transferase LipB, partial [Opitutales bacterium]|nr:lipoyl(octanoyl) transferase LipB [Opitutales bacterium]
LWDSQQLNAQGIAVVESNRGGDITYHGPGQLVAYPIIELPDNRDLHRYLRNLEQVLINAIGCLGLAAHRKTDKTGVWLKDHKLAAIGVAARRGVAYHGFALNVNTDLAAFQGIVPCGIPSNEGQVSSLSKELGQILDLGEVKAIVAKEFWTVFRK